jgi:hypothetical protein
VNETSWAHVWRLRFRYLKTGYDTRQPSRYPHAEAGPVWLHRMS